MFRRISLLTLVLFDLEDQIRQGNAWGWHISRGQPCPYHVGRGSSAPSVGGSLLFVHVPFEQNYQIWYANTFRMELVLRCQPRPHHEVAGSQCFPTFGVPFYLCIHPLSQNYQIWRGNVWGMGMGFVFRGSSMPFQHCLILGFPSCLCIPWKIIFPCNKKLSWCWETCTTRCFMLTGSVPISYRFWDEQEFQSKMHLNTCVQTPSRCSKLRHITHGTHES